MQKIVIGSLMCLGFNSSLQALPADSNPSVELPEMVVTATRVETQKNQLSAASTVYTRDDIERLQVLTLPDLLKNAVGVDMTQNGGMGQTSSVFMRGTNSDHVLVLVDGIKFGSATLGTSPFEFVPMDQVERVEIIRGPQSSLYGSEAIGGVIQIFTRKGAQNDKPTFNLTAGGGSYNTHREVGNISGKWGKSWYNLGASNLDTKGFNAHQATPGFDQPDHDGYQNTSMNARVGHRFEHADVDAFFIRAEGTNAFDAYTGYGDNMTFINQVVGLNGSMAILDNWRSTLRFGQSRDKTDFFYHDKRFETRYDTTRWNVSWLNELTVFDRHKMIAGADYRLDQIATTELYNERSRYDVGVFGELHSQFFDNHFVTASIRWDNNEAFGGYVTGNVGWRYHWDHGISVLANFGNAFKSPSFNQLYYPHYGNSFLRPEESTTVEIGLAGKHDWGQWELRAYHTNIDNLITSVLVNPDTYEYQAQNFGKSQIDGLEAEIGTQILGWNAKLSGNLASPVNRETDKRLPRRVKQKLSFDLSRSYGAIDLGMAVLAQGNRFDDPGNVTRVGGFVTVDLRSAYHINKNWMVSAKLSNLLDKNYQIVNTYNTADRNFFISIHYTN